MFTNINPLAFKFLAAATTMLVSMAATGVFRGRIVNLTPDKITLQEANGMESTLSVSPDVKVTRNGKRATLDELKKTDTVVATTNETQVVLMIDALAVAEVANGAIGDAVAAIAAGNEHQGTLVSAGNGQLSMDIQGVGARTFPLADRVKIMRDGKPASVADLSTGDRVQITTETRQPNEEVVTQIEATSRL